MATKTRKIEVIIAAKDLASRVMGTAMGKMKKSFNAVKKVGLLLTGVIVGVGTALVAMASTTASAGDEALKFSRRIGASVEALTELQHAADLSGVSTSQFNMALQRMTRRVSEAIAGYGEARTALLELGVTTDDLAGKRADEQFMLIAGALSEVENETDRLRLGFKLFDSEGTSVLQMLNEGTEGLKRNRQAAQDLRIVYTELTAEQAEDFVNAYTEAKAAVKGLWREIGTKLIPVFTPLFEKVTEFITKSTAVATAIDKIGGAFKRLAHLAGVDLRTPLDTLRDMRIELENLKIIQARLADEEENIFSKSLITRTVFYGSALSRIGLHSKETAADIIALEAAIRAEEEAFISRQETEKVYTDLGPPSGGPIFDLTELEQFEKWDIERLARMEAADEQAAARRFHTERNLQNQIMGLRFAAANHATALLHVLGNKNKAFAVAALAFQKGLAIAQVFIQTEVAAAAALAPPPIGLGPLVGAALAAKIRLFGKLSMGLIAATGIAEAAISGGGSPSGIGGGGGIGALPVSAPNTGVQAQPTTHLTVKVYTLDGADLNWAKIAEDNIKPALEGLKDRNIEMDILLAET